MVLLRKPLTLCLEGLYTAKLKTTPASVPEPSTNSSIGVVAALMLLYHCYRKSR